MATTKNRRDLVLRALDVLGVSAVGQAPAAEDIAAVDGQVDTMLGTLAGLEVVYVPDVEEIPVEWFSPLADILAFSLCVDFGVGDTEKAEIATKDAQARRDLRFMNRGSITFDVVKAEYF